MMNISKLKINYLTYLFIIMFLFSGFKNNLILLFIVFLFHEMGHLFFIWIFKINIISMEILPFGGVIKLDNLINYPLTKRFLVASGGIIFQLLLLLLNAFIIKSNLIEKYNLMFLFINIVPVIPLDGNKLFQILLSNYVSYYISLISSYVVSIISILFIVIGCYLKNSINYGLILILILFLIKELREFSYIFNRFLLERYLYDFKFKKRKYYRNCNLKNLHINKYGFFFENTWKNEKELLSKKFDNCSYFW